MHESCTMHDSIRKMVLTNYRSKVSVCTMAVVILVYFQWAEIQTLARSLIQIHGAPVDILTTEMTDPLLFDVIRNKYLVPPSREPYKLEDPSKKDYTQYQFFQLLNDLFPETKRQRFFIEAGAFDGEALSNTLNFEKDRNWTGLLVEPNPVIFERLKAKKRKAWLVNTCLSTSTKPINLTLEFHKKEPAQSRLLDKEKKFKGIWSRSEAFEKTLTCLPIFSILSAINVSTVDFFSLDVEGAEMDVLKTIPFEKLYIKVLLIEMWDMKNDQLNLVKFMEEKKYIQQPFPSIENFLFLHPKFKRERE